MSTDAEAMKEYAAAGVDLPELKVEEEKAEPEKEVPKETPAPEEAKAEPDAPSPEPTESRKRSIYEEYKEKKAELRSEKDLREQAERERDELQGKLDALSKAPTAEKREDAEDEVAAYAKEIGADPQAIGKLVELARKGMKPELPEELTKGLAEFQQWKSQNAKVIEAHAFEQEFNASLPAIKEILPNATDDELKTIKDQVDKLSHTTAFHDKPLDYVVFKNRETLSALISPRKPGLEKKGRVESEKIEFEFDPSADYSKLSSTEQVKWEEAYKKMTSSNELLTDASGRKTL